MLIYKNTFDNIKTINCNFPVEDQFYASDNEAIVADGITRDPIGISDFSKYTEKEFLDKYPRPSGAELAAKAICSSFSKTKGSLTDRMIKCNESVKKLNDKYVKNCDYLENDYYGAVASSIHIEKNILYYSYICDCGVIVYDKLGNINFKTPDEKELYSDPYVYNLGISWNLPETRKIVRRDYRNQIDNKINGQCISYGALTGEESALNFIRSGEIKLSPEDLVLVYSDGFTKLLDNEDFIKKIINFNKDEFEKYIEEISKTDYEKFGKEKTIVLFENI